jgi:hypothetical protein
MGVRGDTAGMVAVQAAIDEVKEYMEGNSGDAEKMLVGTWSIQQAGTRYALTIKSDFTFKCGPAGNGGMWKITDGKWRATLHNGAYFETSLPIKAKMVVLQVGDAGGNWTFEKQK